MTKAVIVGIERYAAGDSWDLDGPVNDAVRFAHFLTDRGVPSQAIRCFLAPLDRPGKDAELGRLKSLGCGWGTPDRTTLVTLFEDELRKELCDPLILFWSGHGFIAGRGQERRLFTSDAEESTKRHINLNGLLDAFSSDRYPRMRRIHAIVDACANHVAGLDEALPKQEFGGGRIVRGREQRVLMAARPGEYARNLNAEQTGLFTRELLTALADEPGPWPPDFARLSRRLAARFGELKASGEARHTPTIVWVNDGDEKISDLPDRDRRDVLLSRLAVFQSSFTFLAAKAVCPDFRALEIDMYLRDLAAARHLQPFSTFPRRFELSPGAVSSARARLDQHGEAEKAHEWHANYYAALVQRHEAALKSASRRGSMVLLEREAPNIDAALDWCKQSSDRIELGLKLAGGLCWYWILSGEFHHGRRHLEELLDSRGWERGTRGHAMALYADGALAFMDGCYDLARARLTEAERCFRREPKDADRDRRLAYTLVVLARVTRSPDLAEEAFGIFRDLDDLWGQALTLNDWGYVLAVNKDWHQARKRLMESQSLWRSLNDGWGEPLSLNNLGMVEAHEKHLDVACRAHEHALSIYLHTGNDWGVAESLKFLAEVELYQNNFTIAEGCFRESLRRLSVNERIQLKVDCMLGLARLLERRTSGDDFWALSNFATSARLLGGWRAQSRLYGFVVPPHHEKQDERLETRLRGRLKDGFDAEQQKGRTSDPDELLKPWLDSAVADLTFDRRVRQRTARNVRRTDQSERSG